MLLLSDSHEIARICNEFKKIKKELHLAKHKSVS